MPNDETAEAAESHPRPSRRKKLLLTLAAIVLTLGLLEAGLRIFGYQPRVANITWVGGQTIIRPAPGLSYLYPPGASFTQHWPSDPAGYFDEGNSIFYRVNNYGFRGDDFSLARTSTVRIALLGDSFCWGVGVKQADHFATVLTELFNESGALGREVEVYNFGMEAYNTREEVALFAHTVAKFDPDVCVIWYFLNDPERTEAADPMDFMGGDDRWRGVRRWCYLLDFALAPLDAYLGERRLVERYQDIHDPGTVEFARMADALKQFGQMCRRQNITPVLAVHPILIDLDDSYAFRQAHQNVVDAATEAGIHAFDLLPAFEGQDGPSLWVHPIDQHPNHTAHRISAEALYDYLLELHRDGKLLSALQ